MVQVVGTYVIKSEGNPSLSLGWSHILAQQKRNMTPLPNISLMWPGK